MKTKKSGGELSSTECVMVGQYLQTLGHPCAFAMDFRDDNLSFLEVVQ